MLPGTWFQIKKMGKYFLVRLDRPIAEHGVHLARARWF